MNLKLIIEKEAQRAEALLAGYLGMYAGSIDLADFDIDRVQGASPAMKRCVRLIQGLAAVDVATNTVARNIVNAVDALAEMVRTPRMAPPTRVLWDMQESIRHTPLNVIRHLAAVIGAVALGVWGTVEKGMAVELGIAVGAMLLILSIGCSLSHLRDPDSAVPKGLLAVCGVGAVVLLLKGILFTFLVFAVVAAGFFLRDIVEWASTASTPAGDRIQAKVGEGDFTFEELYDMSGAPGPSLTGYDKGDND
ncbi:TPA: hypothetical protein ACKP9S_006414 [Pseudomonas aeruginosa]